MVKKESKIQNHDLYEAMKSLVIVVSRILLASRGLKPFREPILMLLDHEKEIVQLSEAKKCAEIMESDVTIRREFASRISREDGTPVEAPGVETIYDCYLRLFLSQYFRNCGAFRFDQDIFQTLYVGFEEYLYSDSLRYMVFAPLAGFESDIDVIQLDRKLKIRRMDQEEVDRLWKPTEPYPPSIIQHMDALAFKFTLEAPLSRKKTRSGIRASVKPGLSEIFEGVITILRLFKSGGVDFFFTQRIPEHWQPSGGAFYGFKQRGDYLGHGEYRLSKDEVGDFIAFWKEFRDVIVKEEFRGHDYLRIALRRFNLGSEEQDPENKFIEFFVAFEALCLQQPSELSYRLGLRTATLLGDSSQEKEEIFHFMKDAYALRSRIVHGKTPKIKNRKVDPKDYVPRLERYLRKSIRKYLSMIEEFKDQQKILDHLHRQILK